MSEQEFKVGDKVYVSRIADMLIDEKQATPLGPKQVWTIASIDHRREEADVYCRLVRSRRVRLSRLSRVPVVDLLGDTVRFHATEEDIGRSVVYTPYPGAQAEDGVITGVNDRYVFVRYGADKGSKATDPRDLQWLAPRV